MIKRLIISSFILSSAAMAAPIDGFEPDPELPEGTYKVTYDSSRQFSDKIADAFTRITGQASVGQAITELAETGYIKKAECDVKMCEVEWSGSNSGTASGSIEGHGVVGGAGGGLSGGSSSEVSFKIKVPCDMLADTIRQLQEKKEGN